MTSSGEFGKIRDFTLRQLEIGLLKENVEITCLIKELDGKLREDFLVKSIPNSQKILCHYRRNLFLDELDSFFLTKFNKAERILITTHFFPGKIRYFIHPLHHYIEG
jgi:hypothetical protein